VNIRPIDVIEKILEAGRCSPSADNSQPWKLRVHENKIDVIHDTTRSTRTALYNIDGVFDFLGLGMLVENIAQAASSLGFSTDVEESFSGDHELRLTVTLTPSSPSASSPSLYDSIFKRATDRRGYERKCLRPAIKCSLETLAKQAGHTLYFVEDKKELEAVAQHLGSGDRLFWGNALMRENLLSMLRLDERIPSTDGLPLYTLGLGATGPLLVYVLGLAKRFPVLYPLLGAAVSQGSQKTIRASGALCLLTAPLNPDLTQSAVAGGRIFERLWLTLESENVRLQPLFAPLVLMANEERGSEGLSPKEIKQAARITNFFKEKWPCLRDKERAIAFFRVGYSTLPPLPPSPKRPLSALIEN
jgi:nitroreductase